MSQFDTDAYYRDNRAAQRVALLVVCLGSFLNPLILSSVHVAVPSIATEFGADAVIVSWVPTAFLLTTVILMLPFGKLADIQGRKRTYLRGITILCLASLLASMAQNIWWLIGCRVLQGVGAAQIFGTGMAIVTAVYPRERRGGALGYVAASVYVGLFSGPLMGGFFTEHMGWRSVFLFQLPLGILVVLLTLWKLKGDWKADVRPRFDVTGSLVFAAWAISVLLGLSSMPSWHGGFMLLLSVAFGWLFLHHQSRVDQPLVQIQAIRANRVFLYSLISSFLLYSATFPVTFLLSLYLQYIQGVSPGLAGQLLVVQAVIMAILAPFAGKLSDRYEPRVLTTIGALSIATGFGVILGLGYDTPLYMVPLSQVFIGIGFGFFSTPNNNAAMSSLKRAGLGMASATVNLSRTLGNMIGMGIVMMIIAIIMNDAPIVPENYDALLSSIRLALALSFGYALTASFFCYARGNMRGAAEEADEAAQAP